jgi:nucleoid-associated protein YgaU
MENKNRKPSTNLPQEDQVDKTDSRAKAGGKLPLPGIGRPADEKSASGPRDVSGLASRQQPATAPQAENPAFLTQHTVVAGESLSSIAAKYYQLAARDKWMAIYEANKETIGANPNVIRVGQVLKIPA